MIMSLARVNGRRNSHMQRHSIRHRHLLSQGQSKTVCHNITTSALYVLLNLTFCISPIQLTCVYIRNTPSCLPLIVLSHWTCYAHIVARCYGMPMRLSNLHFWIKLLYLLKWRPSSMINSLPWTGWGKWLCYLEWILTYVIQITY
jgi:hypothetical protein